MLHPENAELPNEVIDDGIFIDARFVQPENVEPLITVNNEGEGNKKLVKPLQF